MSKGSNRRPASVPESVVEENWRRTFGKGKAGMREQIEELPISDEAKVALAQWAKVPLLSPHTDSDGSS